MKKVMITLMVLVSFSSFARECIIYQKSVGPHMVLKIRDNLTEAKYNNAFEPALRGSEFGISTTKERVDTGEKDPFGDKIIRTIGYYMLYKNGEMLIKTSKADEIIDELKGYGCN